MDELRTRTRVLVVDDDRLIREMISDALVEDGCEVSAASSGAEALEVLAGEIPFDVVVTDLSMREMDGLQLLERVKREYPKLDVIILTGYASLESALQAMRLGAADYLRKPIKQLEIVYSVRQTRLRRRILNENEALRGCLQTFEASRVLAACLDAADVLPLAMDLILHITERQRGVGRLRLALPRPGEGTVVSGFDADVATVLREQIERGKLFDPDSMVPEEGGDTELYTPGLSAKLAQLGVETGEVLEVALRNGREVIGGLWVMSDGRDFNLEERRRCSVLVAQTELALANAERYHQASEKAFIDDVTELYNARYLLSALDRETSRAERGGGVLSVLFLDLDRFKRVNDSHGHLVGSSVLRELGVQLSDCVRSIDTLARYGGDEFTIVLVDTDHQEATEIAERIREIVNGHEFGGAHCLRLTVSIGVATFPEHGRTREQILEASDQAMYLAKAQGRDQVRSANDLDNRRPGVC